MDKNTKIETFAAYIVRKCFTHTKEPKEAWNKRNRGEGVYRGRNQMKRDVKAAHAIDRLAHIRWMRSPFGGNSERHVPKLKRVPREIFE